MYLETHQRGYVTYLRVRLSEDETPAAMDDSLGADILENIPGEISEMCVGKWRREARSHYPLVNTFKFLLVSLGIEAR